jgi:hypothetical protein
LRTKDEPVEFLSRYCPARQSEAPATSGAGGEPQESFNVGVSHALQTLAHGVKHLPQNQPLNCRCKPSQGARRDLLFCAFSDAPGAAALTGLLLQERFFIPCPVSMILEKRDEGWVEFPFQPGEQFQAYLVAPQPGVEVGGIKPAFELARFHLARDFGAREIKKRAGDLALQHRINSTQAARSGAAQ